MRGVFELRLWGLGLHGSFPKLGVPFWGIPSNKNHSIVGPILGLGSPHFGTLPYRRGTNTLQLPFRRVYPIVSEFVLDKPWIFGFLVVPKFLSPYHPEPRALKLKHSSHGPHLILTPLLTPAGHYRSAVKVA